MKELELSNCIKVFQILMNKTLNRVVFAEIVTIIFLWNDFNNFYFKKISQDQIAFLGKNDNWTKQPSKICSKILIKIKTAPI